MAPDKDSISYLKPQSVSEQLTLIITTSPVPSAPSTELLTAVLDSFQTHCAQLLQCKTIVVLDTYDNIRTKANLKRGQVTVDGVASYDLYKSNVKQLFHDQYLTKLSSAHTSYNIHHGEAEYGSPDVAENKATFTVSTTPDQRLTFIEPDQRLGFGLAVRTALRLTTTPHVWVHQHDWTLTSDIPVSSILSLMQGHDTDHTTPIQYICLPSIRMLSYHLQGDTLRFPAFIDLMKQLRQTFTVPQPLSTSEPGTSLSSPVSSIEIPLTPLFFWPDKPHIANTAHYLSRVFPSRYAIGRGDFIEDTIGHVARNQMKAGQWHKWATWLYCPGDGKQLCLKHLDGRVWRGVEKEQEMKAIWRERNRLQDQVRQEERVGK